MKTREFVDTDIVSSRKTPEQGDFNASKLNANVSPNQVEIDSRVEEARKQIMELQKQQEELERVRLELEDLSRNQEAFEKGKLEMLQELSRTIAHIEQEEFELNQRSVLLANYRNLYQDHIRQLHDIRESEWGRDDLKSQLAKAVSVVEATRAELNKGRAQLSFANEGPVKLNPDPIQPDRAFDFKLEFQRGLARNFPLIILALVALLWMIARAK